MRRAVPLYEFMPYGAPELLETRQGHMSRALLLTSALALVLYALAGGLASLVPIAPIEPRRIAVRPDHFVLPEARARLSSPMSAGPKASATHPAAAPVAVPDDIAPPGEVPSTEPARTEDVGAGAAITHWELGAATAADALPTLGTWVYVESVPVPVREVRPEYPAIARDARVEGRVTVHVLVGKDGRVLDAVLAATVQVPMLNEAALTAARQWLFTPGLANGKPVACWTAIPFHFRLN